MKVILFDGVCNLCNGLVNFIIERDTNKTFKFASLQSDYARKLLLKFGIDSIEMNSVFYTEDERLYHKSEAVIMILSQIPNFGWMKSLNYIPRFIADVIYELISKYRYKWFGRSSECMLPQDHLKDRFLD